MTLKSDAKFEKRKKKYSKNDKNFVNFDPSTQKSQKYVLSNIGPFCSKYIKFDLNEH